MSLSKPSSRKCYYELNIEKEFLAEECGIDYDK